MAQSSVSSCRWTAFSVAKADACCLGFFETAALEKLDADYEELGVMVLYARSDRRKKFILAHERETRFRNRYPNGKRPVKVSEEVRFA